MKFALVLVLAVVGCEQSPVMPDAAPDAPLGNTFNVAVGAKCDPAAAPLCAGGVAYCYMGTCRDYCQIDRHPDMPCAAGLVETWFTDQTHGGAQTCVCAPQ